MRNSKISGGMKNFMLEAVVIAIAILLRHQAASAQTQGLPKASRTVYKCAVDGKVVYTDEPCLGAQRLDIEPTRGLNKSTGRELSGPDVSREIRREGLAEAVKPITGMTARQLDVQGRRMKLDGNAQAECKRLDSRIVVSEAEERSASGEVKTDVQRGLLSLRKRHRDLGC